MEKKNENGTLDEKEQINKLGDRKAKLKIIEKIHNSDDNKCLLSRSRRKTNREMRKSIIQTCDVIRQFNICNSKLKIYSLFKNLNPKWQNFIKKYLSEWFILHLHVRQIKDFSGLMQQRQNLFEAIDHPEVIMEKITFNNNLIKNFCKGVINFIFMFYDELIKYDLIETQT